MAKADISTSVKECPYRKAIIWDGGKALRTKPKSASAEDACALWGQHRHGNPRPGRPQIVPVRAYSRIAVYEKATGISWCLLLGGLSGNC